MDGPLSREPVEAREVARAYLRIAHLYRTGGLESFATDYYRLVVRRFGPTAPEAAARARLRVAFAALQAGERRAARGWVRPLLKAPRLRASLRGAAAWIWLESHSGVLEPRRAARAKRLLAARLQPFLPPERIARILARARPRPRARRRA